LVFPDRTILLSLAHPDDESFIAAGVTCKYRNNGVRVVLVTATLGEEGKVGDPAVCAREDLPKVREAELMAAARLIGVEKVHQLGYHDRQLEKTPYLEIRERLVTLIRTYRPQIVISFDPNGTNLHPDHIAISRFTADAIAAAADPRWFETNSRSHLVQRFLWTTPVPFWELARSGKMASQPGVDFMIDIQPWISVKISALKTHKTQHLSIDRIFFSAGDPEPSLRYEVFRQAWGPALTHHPSDDLFEGIGTGISRAESQFPPQSLP
jgi:LmbE family N-acetylglucosaminyl deacetylase